jgi:hypothetical protein
MSQSRDDREDMKPEYDIRGGQRGKYLARYRGRPSLTAAQFSQYSFVAKSTSTAPRVGSITNDAVYAPSPPSPKIRVGSTPAPAHAG